MATAMGGSLAASGVNPAPSNGLAASSPSSASPATATRQTSTSVRIFYSLKENPNAIISYTDLVRKEQKKQQRMTDLQTSVSKNGGNAASAGPNASSTQPTSLGPLKNQKVTGTGPLGTSSASNNASKDISSTAMDIDPPEGEEALGEGDSEAEDDDEADEDDDENEEDGEAEDEDDDEDEDEEEDDPDTGRREPKDFLDSLTEKYAGLEENGNDGEDEDEDEDEDEEGKSQVLKRPSRWDTEHYDIEDEFIDDSEMMLEAIGMVRPKVDGFFAYRGPVETTTEDPDSSDAGPRSRKPARRKPPTGSSPLSTGRSGASKGGKGSTLSVMENANDSTSEMSEMDDKPRPSKATTGTSGLANSSTLGADNPTTGGEGAGSSVTTTPTKKKTSPSKGKAVAKDITKETESTKDSDKESKPVVPKKPKAKPSKATLGGASTTTASSATPIVRVDSPPPAEDNVENSTPPPAPSRSTSPAKSKYKGKATVESGSSATATASTSEQTTVTTSSSETGASTSASKSATKPSAGEGSSKSKSPKALEPMNKEVQTAYDVVAELAKKETWEVKTKFPPHIKAPLFECARLALATRSSGYVLEDYFFTHLQAVLPYNKFTLKKLIYKNVLPGWIADLEAQKARLIEQFTTRANMVWRASGLAQQENSQPSEKDVDGDVNMNGEDGKPQKKFPWSQDLRLLLWETMEKFMEILAAKQEYRAIDESQPAPPSDSKTRKDAYQTLLLSFPAGWMTSYEISRQYSQLKEKVQKQEKREVESSSAAVPIGKIKPVFSINSGPRSGSTTNTSRNTAGQSASSAASADKKAAASAPLAATAVSTTPVPNLTSEHALNATAPVSNDAKKDATHRSSPTISPSNLSEILHPSTLTPQQQQLSPRTQNLSFGAGPASAATSSKKRKKPEEGMS
ncbi:hypothetical protein BGZ72_008622 [Mortierella alpina]|nr:hypothetical protein BGZ72_008622 [Mortierella alpina]